jgi:hypothetical protein
MPVIPATGGVGGKRIVNSRPVQAKLARSHFKTKIKTNGLGA